MRSRKQFTWLKAGEVDFCKFTCQQSQYVPTGYLKTVPSPPYVRYGLQRTLKRLRWTLPHGETSTVVWPPSWMMTIMWRVTGDWPTGPLLTSFPGPSGSFRENRRLSRNSFDWYDQHLFGPVFEFRCHQSFHQRLKVGSPTSKRQLPRTIGQFTPASTGRRAYRSVGQRSQSPTANVGILGRTATSRRTDLWALAKLPIHYRTYVTASR